MFRGERRQKEEVKEELEVVPPAAAKAIPPKKAIPVRTVKAVRPAKVA